MNACYIGQAAGTPQLGAALLSVSPVLYYAGAAFLVLLLIGIAIAVHISRHRHDKALAAELEKEMETPAAQALTAEVTVVPQEQLPPEKPTVFMPVPAAVSDVIDFIDEEKDGICVRSYVRAEDVNRMMSNEQANALTMVVFRAKRQGDERAYVYLDTLSDTFAEYSFVNLAILKQYGLVGEEVAQLTVYARGVLRKPLMIEADEFSAEAVKMISLTGGRAILIRE